MENMHRSCPPSQFSFSCSLSITHSRYFDQKQPTSLSINLFLRYEALKVKFVQTSLITMAWRVQRNEQTFSWGIHRQLIFHLHPTCLCHLVHERSENTACSRGWVGSIPSCVTVVNTARGRECSKNVPMSKCH